jgi:hypothetical protein
MRIFFVCRRVPFPPERGDKIATFNEIRHLSRKHEVHVFCLADGTQDLDNITGLQDHVHSVNAVPVTALAIKLRALKALLGGQSLSVAACNEAKLHAAIRRKFDELKPDVIMVYSCNAAQFAEHFPSVPRIMQFGDLDSLRWGQYAERSGLPLKWIYKARTAGDNRCNQNGRCGRCLPARRRSGSRSNPFQHDDLRRTDKAASVGARRPSRWRRPESAM